MNKYYKYLMSVVTIVTMAMPWNIQAQVTCDSGSLVTRSNADTEDFVTRIIPVNSQYLYSYSEQIIPADSLTGLGSIKSLRFNVRGITTNTQFNDCEIYLANVNVDSLGSGFVQDMSRFELVYTGSLSWSSEGWKTIVFDDAFNWDGESNLLIAFRCSNESINLSTLFSIYNVDSVPMAREVHRDSAPYTIGSISGGTACNYGVCYQFIGCEDTAPICHRVRNLEVSNITSSSCTLSWVDTLNSGATYTIYDLSDTSVIATTSSVTYTFSGLNENTLYHFGVRIDCGSTYATINVRTACSGYVDIPYIENFEGNETDGLPSCWQRVSSGIGSGSIFPSVYLFPPHAHGGQSSFRFESASGNSTELVALPAMQNIGELMMTFWASMSDSYPCTFEVGVLESDGSFSRVDSLSFDGFIGTDSWQQNYREYTVYFSNYSGTGERIALRAAANPPSHYILFIDDLMVTENNGCYPLTSVRASHIDSSSITFVWVDTMNTDISYTLSYGPAGGEMTDVGSLADTTYTATGLSNNTLYTFIITPNCPSGDGLPTTMQFRTGCGITPIPYADDFESYEVSNHPSCWTVLNGNSRVKTGHPRTGSRFLFFGGALTNTIVLPPMDRPTNELQVSFWTRPEGYSYFPCGSFSVGYMTDPNDESTFVQLASWNYYEWIDNEYLRKEVPLVGAPDTAYIVLRHQAGTPSYSWYVDDLVVETIPTCEHPLSVSASNITTTTADITIVGDDEHAYRIWWSDGTTVDSTDIFTTFYTLTGLTGGTHYTVSVATICDDGTVTPTVSTSLTTECSAGSCDVVIHMVNEYYSSEGWGNAAINGYIANEQVFSATFTSGHSADYIFHHCSSDSLVLRWHGDFWNSGYSFDIFHGGAFVMSGYGNAFADGAFITSLTGCPACSAPSGFTVDSVGSGEASFHWNSGEASLWQVVVNGDSANATIVGANSLILSNLSANTVYSVAISTICSPNETSMPFTFTFRTACYSMEVPFTEDFEFLPTEVAPTCWEVLSGGPITRCIPDDAHGGNQLLYLGEGMLAAIALPPTDLPTGTLQVRFWARPDVLYYEDVNWGSLAIGYMTDLSDTSTFVEKASWSWNEFSGYEEKVVPMLGAPGDARIVLRRDVDISSYLYWFVDDLTVEPMPSCMPPSRFSATSVTDNRIDVAFSGSPSGNYIVYITDSAAYSDSVQVTTGTHSFTGLTPQTRYTIAVVSDCGNVVSPSQSITVSTTTRYADVPPFYTGFETGQDTNWLLIGGTQVNQWFIDTAARNGGRRALYISDDGGASNEYDIASLASPSDVYASKLLSLDTGNYAVSYDWRSYGRNTKAYLRVFLVPAYVELNAGDRNQIFSTGAPEGWIPLDGGCELCNSSSWRTYACNFSVAEAGNYNLVFFWHNELSTGTQPPAAIDNVLLIPVSCPSPTDVRVSHVTGVSAEIAWTPSGDETEWMVTVGDNSEVVSSPIYIATGLSNSTQYNVNVRAICGAGDTSVVSETVHFTTPMCNNGFFIFNHDTASATAISTTSPVGNSTYNYSYVQTIITADLLTDLDGDITALAFKTARTYAGDQFSNITVYMANVSENNLSAGFIHPDASHVFVKVIDSADFSYTTIGWQVHFFENFFQWDGTSNVLVVFKRDHGSWASGSSFVAYNSNAERTRSVYRDSDPYDINTVSGGITESTEGLLQLISCGDTCYAPVIRSTYVNDVSATVEWSGVAEDYEVSIVEGAWIDTSLIIPLSSLNTYTFTGLTPGTQYTVGVRAVCDGTSHSDWVVRTVITADMPCYTPGNVTVGNITMTGASIGWTVGEEDQTDFQIRLSVFGRSTIINAYQLSATNYQLANLVNGTEYSVEVRAVCGEGYYSAWSTPVTFQTVGCPSVVNVTVGNITMNSALVTWTASGANSYEVGYGPQGVTTSNCIRHTTTDNSYTITGLGEGSNYVVYIRSICGEGIYSIWSDGTPFITDGVGILDVLNDSIVLYPNPASNTVTLTGIESGSTVTIMDMSGRKIQEINCSGSQITSFDIGLLTSGVYFVRILTPAGPTTKKLLVQ